MYKNVKLYFHAFIFFQKIVIEDNAGWWKLSFVNLVEKWPTFLHSFYSFSSETFSGTALL